MSYRLTPPMIRWGSVHQYAAYFGFPVDNVTSWSDPRQGSEFDQAPSGVEDSWLVGFDQVLAGELRWIPGSDTLFYPRCTGWDYNANTPGIRQFLEWAKQKNQFTWIGDGRNCLLYPTLTSATIDYSVSSSGKAGWTSGTVGSVTGGSVSFDSGNGAWKVTGTASATGTNYVTLTQYFPAITGEAFYLSVDYKTSGLVTGANGAIYLDHLDTNYVYQNTVASLTNLTATGWTRVTTGLSTAFGAGATYGSVSLRLLLPTNAGTGSIWFRNAMVRRDSSDTTFIDNSYVQECYWVDPQAAPGWESDGQRKLAMKIRQSALDFSGY